MSKEMCNLVVRAAVLVGMLALAGCGGDNGGTGGGPQDMATANVLSQCGHPGDVGNSLGVGRFCTKLSDCGKNGEQTNICSALGNGPTPSASDTYFCTIYPCTPDGGTSECGENATCVCGSSSGGGGCACTPNSCK
jgi:hypothetical protein